MESTISLYILLLVVITTQQEWSQFPLVEMELYYFSTYILAQNSEGCIFDVRLNDDDICTARADHNELNDYAPGSFAHVLILPVSRIQWIQNLNRVLYQQNNQLKHQYQFILSNCFIFVIYF